MAESEYKNVWSYGPYLIARHRVAQFPARCLICGEENGCTPLLCTVRKRPGMIHVLVLWFGMFAPSVTLEPFFCTKHRGQELRSRWIGHTMLLLTTLMITIPIMLAVFGADFPIAYAAAAMGAILFWLVWWPYRIFRRRIVYAEYIKQRDAWLQGVHQSIMEQITALPYPAAE